MIENNTIKKMVAGILRGRKNASFDRHIMHPNREWFVAVFIGLVLFAIGIGWNVSIHLQFKSASISSGPVVEETIVYRAGLVDSALADFEVRKREYEELKKGLLVRQVAVPIVPEIVNVESEEVTIDEIDEEEEEPALPDTPDESGAISPDPETVAPGAAFLVI